MKKVLFVCKANVGRSQMAEMFLKKFRPDFSVTSAGVNVSKPGQKIGDKESAADVVNGMKEYGIDMSNNVRKQVDREFCKDADVIVTMVEENEIPDYLKEDKRVVRWHIEDPYDKGIETTKMLRDQIKGLVENTFGKEM